jgi:hypothetical protein
VVRPELGTDHAGPQKRWAAFHKAQRWLSQASKSATLYWASTSVKVSRILILPGAAFFEATPPYLFCSRLPDESGAGPAVKL